MDQEDRILLFKKLAEHYNIDLTDELIDNLHVRIFENMLSLDAFSNDDILSFFIASPFELNKTIEMFRNFGHSVLTYADTKALYFGNPDFFDRHYLDFFDLLYRAEEMSIPHTEIFDIFKRSYNDYDKYKHALFRFEELVIDEEILIGHRSNFEKEMEKIKELFKEHQTLINKRWLTFNEACEYSNRGKNWLQEKLNNGDIYGYQEHGEQGKSGKWIVDRHSIDQFYLTDSNMAKLKFEKLKTGQSRGDA
ncbi:MAG: helix-turn-helix domain-containing protein [Deferribacterales bacterium]